MPDTKQLLDRAERNAPQPRFDLKDVRRRRERREKGRRIRAGALGMAITASLVIGALVTIGPLGQGTVVRPATGGEGLPAAQRPPAALAAGEYSYQRILFYESCPEANFSPDAPCAKRRIHLESWWALDDSGRKEVLDEHGYGGGLRGTFGPGEFPDEGDLSAFPTDPEALEAFLLERSAPNGASPRPDVTPAPGVPLQEGLLWNAIRDYLGSTQYLNATPELRAGMLRVLAKAPMVQVDLQDKDPIGRDAYRLWFHAYNSDVQIFVDPETGDFMAMTEDYAEESGYSRTWVTVVEEAGFTSTDDARPEGGERTIVPPKP